MSSDLTDFLLARIAEDEAAAQAGVSGQADPENGWGYYERALTPHVGIIHEAVQAAHIIRWHPYRVLAECEAKRRIVEWTVRLLGMLTENERRRRYGDKQPLELRALALPYADHPDFDPSWRLDLSNGEHQ